MNKYAYARIWQQLLPKLETINLDMLKNLNHKHILESYGSDILHESYVQNTVHSIIDTLLHNKQQIAKSLAKNALKLESKLSYISLPDKQQKIIDHLIDLKLIYETFKQCINEQAAKHIATELHKVWLKSMQTIASLKECGLL